MSIPLPEIDSTPFDSVALRYDETFTSSKIGKAQRASVWHELEQAFHLGDRVLEIGCGTGVDACFLAERGVHVLATDSSPRMIAVASRRVQDAGVQKLVAPVEVAAEGIGSLLDCQEPFDGAFSNFAAVNCVRDLDSLARDLHGLLRPRAKLLLCCFGSCCLWEIAWYLTRGKPGKAFRRVRSESSAQIGDGPLKIYYPSVRSLKRAFFPWFAFRSARGIGVLVPPSYLEPWAVRFPRLLQLSVQADSWLAHCPGIRVLADHVLLEFERCEA